MPLIKRRREGRGTPVYLGGAGARSRAMKEEGRRDTEHVQRREKEGEGETDRERKSNKQRKCRLRHADVSI